MNQHFPKVGAPASWGEGHFIELIQGDGSSFGYAWGALFLFDYFNKGIETSFFPFPENSSSMFGNLKYKASY